MKILIAIPFMFDSYLRSDFIQNLIKNSKEVTFIYFEKIDIDYSNFKNCRFISNNEFFKNQNIFEKINFKYKALFLNFIRKISFHLRRDINSTYKCKIKDKHNIFIRLMLIFFSKDFILMEKKLRKLFEFLTKENLKIKTFIEQNNYDHAYIITKIHDQTLEWRRVLKKNNIKTTQIIHSWDNLTSKGMFIVEPEKLLVWGNFDKEIAIKEHNISSDIISIINPIILSTYIKPLIYKNMPFNHLLFAGVTPSLVNNEFEYVKELSKNLYKIDKKLNLIYRPHPRVLNKKNSIFQGPLIELDTFKYIKYNKNIYIDIHLQNHKESMKYLQAKCCCVITFYSTVALEFILSGRSAINFSFEIPQLTKINKNVPKYTHNLKLKDESMFLEANNLTELNMLIKNCTEGKIKFNDYLKASLEISNLN